MLMEFLQTPAGGAVVGAVATLIVAVVVALWRVYTLAHVNQAEIRGHKDECDKRGELIQKQVEATNTKLYSVHEDIEILALTVATSVAHGKQQQQTISRVETRVDTLVDQLLEKKD